MSFLERVHCLVTISVTETHSKASSLRNTELFKAELRSSSLVIFAMSKLARDCGGAVRDSSLPLPLSRVDGRELSEDEVVA
jgi:hypothetical protein